MEEPELQELLRHGMEAGVGQDIVIVMVADELPVQVHRERPEAVNCHFLTQAQGGADQEEPRGKALGVDAFALPELADVPQEVGVGKEHCLLGTEIRQGVVDAEGGPCPCFHGEGWHVDVAVVIDLHTVHKGSSGPQQILEPGKSQGKMSWSHRDFPRCLIIHLRAAPHTHAYNPLYTISKPRESPDKLLAV